MAHKFLSAAVKVVILVTSSSLYSFIGIISAINLFNLLNLLFLSLKLDRPPSKCIVFEDDPRGITAAHNCSMKAIAIIGAHPAYV